MQCRVKNCIGVVNPKSIHSYQNHLIMESEECSHCDYTSNLTSSAKTNFEKSVDLFKETAKETWETGKTKTNQCKKKHEEIFSQAILQTIMREHQIIHMDNGNKNHQYDLLARKNGESIAIEVTQATCENALKNSSYFNQNPIHTFKGSQYNWTINIHKEADLPTKNMPLIQALFMEIESYHLANDGCTNIGFLSYIHKKLPAFIKLQKFGILGFSAQHNINGTGTLSIASIGESSSYDIKNILKIVNHECTKQDNIKKLELARVDKKHVFIPITAFKSGAAYYLENMPKTQNISSQWINQNMPEVCCLFPNIIDAVWLATLMNFNQEGKMGFRLAKITREKEIFRIENISNGIFPYSK